MRNNLLLIVIFVLLFGLATNASGESLQEAQARGGEVLTVTRLCGAFKENIFSVKMQYKDTGVTVWGIIYDVALTDDEKNILIILKGDYKYTYNYVILWFNKDQSAIDKISKLKTGQGITAHGYPYNKFYESGCLFVIVKDCTIVDDTTQQK